MSPRIVQLPVSGRDRKHFVRELARVQRLQTSLMRKSDDAFRAADEHLQLAHRYLCEEWTARQWIGGPVEPSPTIEQALHGGCALLEVTCRRCYHSQNVDLAEVVWPRQNPIHTLRRALVCRTCKEQKMPKSRPELVALRMREQPNNEPSSAAARRPEIG